MIDALVDATCTAIEEHDGGGNAPVQVRITGMGQTREGLLMRLAITYCDTSVSRWQVLAKGVRHGSIRVQTQGLPELCSDHDLLIPYGPWAKLTVQGTPGDRFALMGSLWEAHDATVGNWIKPWEFLDAHCLVFDPDAEGTDLLAEGPIHLLRAYAHAADAVGVKTTLEAYGDEPEAAPDLKVFTLGNSWIVAKSFVCEQIVPVCNSCAAKFPEGDATPVDEHTHGHAHLKLLPTLDGVEVPETPHWAPSGGTA